RSILLFLEGIPGLQFLFGILDGFLALVAEHFAGFLTGFVADLLSQHLARLVLHLFRRLVFGGLHLPFGDVLEAVGSLLRGGGGFFLGIVHFFGRHTGQGIPGFVGRRFSGIGRLFLDRSLAVASQDLHAELRAAERAGYVEADVDEIA